MKMYKCLVIVMMALTLLLAPANTEAQEGSFGQQGQFDQNRPPHPPPSPVIMALDSDRDHEFSAAEISSAAESLLTLDKNGDGKLSGDELRPNHPGNPPMDAQENDDRKMEQESGHPQGPPPDPIMMLLDINRDAELSSAEITGAVEALKTLDQNGDGKLTHRELRPKGRDFRQEEGRQRNHSDRESGDLD